MHFFFKSPKLSIPNSSEMQPVRKANSTAACGPINKAPSCVSRPNYQNKK